MSVAEETIKESAARAREIAKARKQTVGSRVLNFLNGGLNVLSSVRFGVFLLIVMGVLSMIGMLVVQQNVQGFENFYAGMTPAEKLVYNYLGFFDIYHAWYFNILLLVLSLNIVLASIDRFPTAWSYIAKPKLEATKAYLLNQKFNAQIETHDAETAVEKVGQAFKKSGFSPRVTTKDNGRKIFFAQKNVFNRLGAYVVHVALLLLFLGHFVALQTGFDADVRLIPGQTTNQIELIRYNLDKQERAPIRMPFALSCTDIEQKLVDKNGGIDVGNTLDWATRVRVDDATYGSREANISLNQPFTYRGFRFFQASAVTVGSARNMTLQLTPANGGEPVIANLKRNGTTVLPDNTKIEYQGFFADFVLNGGKPDTRTGDYNNPAVQLRVTNPNGESKMAYAFAADLPSGAPVGAPVFGYKYKLAEFEKVPLAHVLSIKYDPYYGSTIAWYYGGGLLVLSLFGVFFFAHQRIWAIVEPNGKITLGGHTNRNETGFEDKFKKLTAELNQA